MNEISEAQIENIVRKVANELSEHSTTKIQDAVGKKIDEKFTTYGFDTKSPLEIQKDMAFINKMRKIVDSMVMRAIALFLAGGTVIGIGFEIFKKTKE